MYVPFIKAALNLRGKKTELKKNRQQTIDKYVLIAEDFHTFISQEIEEQESRKTVRDMHHTINQSDLIGISSIVHRATDCLLFSHTQGY